MTHHIVEEETKKVEEVKKFTKPQNEDEVEAVEEGPEEEG